MFRVYFRILLNLLTQKYIAEYIEQMRDIEQQSARNVCVFETFSSGVHGDTGFFCLIHFLCFSKLYNEKKRDGIINVVSKMSQCTSIH